MASKAVVIASYQTIRGPRSPDQQLSQLCTAHYVHGCEQVGLIQLLVSWRAVATGPWPSSNELSGKVKGPGARQVACWPLGGPNPDDKAQCIGSSIGASWPAYGSLPLTLEVRPQAVGIDIATLDKLLYCIKVKNQYRGSLSTGWHALPIV